MTHVFSLNSKYFILPALSTLSPHVQRQATVVHSFSEEKRNKSDTGYI